MPYKGKSYETGHAMYMLRVAIQQGHIYVRAELCANNLVRDAFRLSEWLNNFGRTDEAEKMLLDLQQVI
jgi:hypothetical protein